MENNCIVYSVQCTVYSLLYMYGNIHYTQGIVGVSFKVLSGVVAASCHRHWTFHCMGLDHGGGNALARKSLGDICEARLSSGGLPPRDPRHEDEGDGGEAS